MRTLLHLSDIHFGRFDDSLERPFFRAVAQIEPAVVVVSGDLTQRARPGQFRQARQFLNALPGPKIVVPGNHDVPLHNVYHRLSAPLASYRRYITDNLEPFYQDEELAVLGVNTARALIWKNGRINARQIARIRDRFCRVAPGTTKVLVTHHPFDLPDGYTSRDLVGRARLAMITVADCGIDLLLAGHFHIGRAGHTAVRYSSAGHSSIFVQAGTLSTRGRGEPPSFNVLRILPERLEVDRHAFDESSGVFVKKLVEVFERGPGGWRPA